MIYLNFNMLDKPFSLEEATILSIEDTELFAFLTESFFNYNEDGPLKIFNAEEEKMSPQMVITITDILNYDLNSTSLLKKVSTDVLNQLNDALDTKDQLELELSNIEELLRHEFIEHDLLLETEELTIEKLLKIVKPHLSLENTLLRKAFQILDVHHYTNAKSLLVFINSLSYFSLQEKKSLIEYINLNSLRVLFLEPRQVSGLSQYFLDKDFFLSRI